MEQPTKANQKHWCFTINNPTEADLEIPQSAYDYCVVGTEVGEEGTRHYQGYIVLKKKQRFSGLKRLLPRAHIEPMHGTPYQASEYCKKDGDFQECGLLPRSGGEVTQDKYADAKRKAIEGDLDEIDPSIFVRCYGNLKRIKKDHPSELACNDVLENYWYYGESGCGKSRKAWLENPDAYRKPANKWWDGYEGQDVVVLEDLDPAHSVLAHHLKLWGDHYPFMAEEKGGGSLIRPKKIIITSQYLPEDIWQENQQWTAIRRRFKLVKFSDPKIVPHYE